MFKQLPLLLLSALGLSLAQAETRRPAEEPYVWKNVRIGGGGFVSGLVFHPKEKGLGYARTDVGGAYRWDEESRTWTPLTDFLGMDEVNLTGIESLALDPADSSRVYLATGTYTNERVGNGALFRSSDRGRSFLRSDLPFKLGGNEAGRGNGERLAVDPNNGSILLLGSRRDGLWRSTDHGAGWTRVDSFPSLATSLEASEGGPWKQMIGIVFVVFDPSSGKPGTASRRVWAGISMKKSPLQVSEDGGLTWRPVPGQPEGLRPTRPSLASDGTLYLSYGDEPGPNTMKDGAVWKLDTRTGKWTDITPLRPGAPGVPFGYGAVTADPSDPAHLLASTFCRYQPEHDEIFRSTDGGATWSPVFASSIMDHSQAPWCDQHTPHWMADLRIDPFDRNHALFVTGYGVYRTRNLGDLGSGKPVRWLFDNTGLEETVPLGLVSPPEGAHLLSALGDIDGFRHEDLDRAGLTFNSPPRFANSESIAYAAKKPAIIVRCGTIRERTDQVRAALSLDGGMSWKALLTEPEGSNGAGRVSLSADGSIIAWTPRGLPPAAATGRERWRPWPGRACVTRDLGASWQTCKGLPPGVNLVPDPQDPLRFHGYDAGEGILYTSEDGGLHFTAVNKTLPSAKAGAGGFGGGPAHPGILHSVWGLPGELWLETRSEGLFHSTDGGRHFRHLSQVSEAYSLGFGKAAPGRDRPSLFLAGKISGEKALFRSDDDGATWLRITDDTHRFGWINHVTGDPRIHGRVYFGTGGRGILYGDKATGQP